MNYRIIYSDELYHHGVKGMKWGVRRKEKNLMLARQFGKEQQRIAEAYKKDYSPNQTKKDVAEYKKKYPDTNKWLDDMYGKGWKNQKYMKEAFGVSDVHKHARAGMKKDIRQLTTTNSELFKVYSDSAKNWASKNNKWANTPVSQLSKSDYKEIKKYARRQKKVNKRRA